MSGKAMKWTEIEGAMPSDIIKEILKVLDECEEDRKKEESAGKQENVQPEGETPSEGIQDEDSGTSDNGSVIHPSYYSGKIEVFDFVEDKQLGFPLGLAIKYIVRAGRKDPSKEIEDLQKAIYCIERRIYEIRREKTA